MAMDGLYAGNAGAVAGDAMDGLYAGNAGAVAGDGMDGPHACNAGAASGQQLQAGTPSLRCQQRAMVSGNDQDCRVAEGLPPRQRRRCLLAAA